MHTYMYDLTHNTHTTHIRAHTLTQDLLLEVMLNSKEVVISQILSKDYKELCRLYIFSYMQLHKIRQREG